MSINSYFCTVCGRNLFTWKNADGICTICKREEMLNTACDVCTYPLGSHSADQKATCQRAGEVADAIRKDAEEERNHAATLAWIEGGGEYGGAGE